MGGIIAAIIAALGSVVSSAVGARSAHKQSEFQERMSGTAHQREVEDLRRAGLNPILSAGGTGASSPQGTMFTPDNPLRGFGETYISNKVANAGIKRQEAETRSIEESINTQITQQELNSAARAR